MIVLPPGRFSTTTGWPHASVSLGPIRRAWMSAGPPGANGTIKRIGFAGYCCAKDTPADNDAIADSTTVIRCRTRFIRFLSPEYGCGIAVDLGEQCFEFPGSRQVLVGPPAPILVVPV